MPNFVDTRLEARGPASEIERLLATCFRMTDPHEGTVEFDFASIIPIAGYPYDAESVRQASCHLLTAAWGTKWNARETVVRRLGPQELEISFVTPWSMPEPVFRMLGRHYPQLSFRIEAIDPDCWAIEGKVEGPHAEFRECKDFDAVFNRFYSVIDPTETPERAGSAPATEIAFRIIERKS